MGKAAKPDPREDAVLTGVRAGASLEGAAAAAGVDPATLRRWQADRRFADALRTAEGQTEMMGAARLTSAARSGDASANAALLDRIASDRIRRSIEAAMAGDEE